MNPVDTYANNTSVGRFLNQGVFAYSPIALDGNIIIRDAKWWNTNLFFRRMYRESTGNFKFSVKPKMK